MNYNEDQDLRVLWSPVYESQGYPGNPGPSTWQEFGLGQVDPDTAKHAWMVYAAAALVGASVLYLVFKKGKRS